MVHFSVSKQFYCFRISSSSLFFYKTWNLYDDEFYEEKKMWITNKLHWILYNDNLNENEELMKAMINRVMNDACVKICCCFFRYQFFVVVFFIECKLVVCKLGPHRNKRESMVDKNTAVDQFQHKDCMDCKRYTITVEPKILDPALVLVQGLLQQMPKWRRECTVKFLERKLY